MRAVSIEAEPTPLWVDLDRTALVIIDMQRDFLEPGGFGETLGNDVSLPAAGGRALPRGARRRARRRHAGHPHARGPPARSLRRAAGQDRARRTRRCASARRARWAASWSAASRATTSSPSCYPIAGEPVIDKPGKGAFYQTDLDAMLRNRGIETLLVCGVTTEVCVNTTVREANDRGYRCVVLGRLLRAPTFPNSTQVGLAHDQGAGRRSSAGCRTSTARSRRCGRAQAREQLTKEATS